MLVLVVAIALFLLAMLVSAALVAPEQGDGAILLSMTVSVIGYVLYWLVLLATGFSHRFVATIACIMACGSILTIAMVIAFVVLGPLLGASIASILAWLILLWSVPVKGHIIARAIERHWYIGIAISLVIYILQRLAFDALMSNAGV